MMKECVFLKCSHITVKHFSCSLSVTTPSFLLQVSSHLADILAPEKPTHTQRSRRPEMDVHPVRLSPLRGVRKSQILFFCGQLPFPVFSVLGKSIVCLSLCIKTIHYLNLYKYQMNINRNLNILVLHFF